MTLNCITKRDVEKVLSPNVFTFKNNRITYKGRDITLSNGFNKIFNINSTNLSDPNEIVDAGIKLTTYSEIQKSIRLNNVDCSISVYIGLGTIALLKVFTFEILEPLMIVKNSDGSVSTSGGDIKMRTIRWIYDYFSEPYEFEQAEVFFKLLPSTTSFNTISSPHVECILPVSYYDNVESFFNTNLRCKLYKDISNRWIFDLPTIDVYYGDKPPFYTRFNYINGEYNYIVL